jgi:V8-like Glu-specific endopeptidase
VRGKLIATHVITAAAVMWPLAAAAPAADTAMAAGISGPDAAVPTVGALFTRSGGQLGTHFCTASVVNSPAGDLLVTAAHCLTGYALTAPAGLAFVPGYDRGAAPYGVWTVTRAFVDPAWASASSVNDDVAFLTVAPSGRGAAIESVTGGERLGTGQRAGQVVRVTGYPDASDEPLSCGNYANAVGPAQLEFDCAHYTDGTSGGPFLARDGTTGPTDEVIGVIGGYQQGGDSPDISYSAVFGPSVAALYATAVAAA